MARRRISAGGGLFGARDDAVQHFFALGQRDADESAPSSMVMCGLWSKADMMWE